MNALDDLEAALGDSMESLNCSSDDEPSLDTKPVQHSPQVTQAPRVSVKVSAAAPLLVDDDDGDSDRHSDEEENVSLCSFGSTADLRGFNPTAPLPGWVSVCI